MKRSACMRRLVLAATAYVVLSVIILIRPALIDAIAESIRRWLRLLFVMVLGPAAILVEGFGAVWWFMAVLGGVTLCIGLSWVAWLRFPDSQMFAIGLIAAALLWAFCPCSCCSHSARDAARAGLL